MRNHRRRSEGADPESHRSVSPAMRSQGFLALSQSLPVDNHLGEGLTEEWKEGSKNIPEKRYGKVRKRNHFWGEMSDLLMLRLRDRRERQIETVNKKPEMGQTEEKIQDWRDISVVGGEGESLERTRVRHREHPSEKRRGETRRKSIYEMSPCVDSTSYKGSNPPVPEAHTVQPICHTGSDRQAQVHLRPRPTPGGRAGGRGWGSGKQKTRDSRETGMWRNKQRGSLSQVGRSCQYLTKTEKESSRKPSDEASGFIEPLMNVQSTEAAMEEVHKGLQWEAFHNQGSGVNTDNWVQIRTRATVHTSLKEAGGTAAHENRRWGCKIPQRSLIVKLMWTTKNDSSFLKVLPIAVLMQLKICIWVRKHWEFISGWSFDKYSTRFASAVCMWAREREHHPYWCASENNHTCTSVHLNVDCAPTGSMFPPAWLPWGLPGQAPPARRVCPSLLCWHHGRQSSCPRGCVPRGTLQVNCWVREYVHFKY